MPNIFDFARRKSLHQKKKQRQLPPLTKQFLTPSYLANLVPVDVAAVLPLPAPFKNPEESKASSSSSSKGSPPVPSSLAGYLPNVPAVPFDGE